MSTPQPQEQPAATPAGLADWGTRAVGFLIDYLPVLILQVLTIRSTFLTSLIGLVNLLYLLYLGHLDGATGQTPGKAIQGIRVVNGQGELIGSGNGMARKLLHIVDSLICLLGWFLPLVDAKRQTIADKIMSTYVVVGVEKKPFSVDLWRPPRT